MSSFKTVYFPDYSTDHDGKPGLTVAFGDADQPLFTAASRLSSFGVRNAIGHDSFAEVQRAANNAGLGPSAYVRMRLAKALSPGRLVSSATFDTAVQSTFAGGRGSPLHDWFPYLEGYSPEFVRAILDGHAPDARSILDPFCGSGTTAITSAQMGLAAGYCEVNPVCRAVISAKVLAITCGTDRRDELISGVRRLATTIGCLAQTAERDASLGSAASATFGTRPFFAERVFNQILSLRTIVDQIATDDKDLALLLEVAVSGVLVVNSNLIRRGDLRFKTGRELERTPDLIGDVEHRLALMASDMRDVCQASGTAALACNDARVLDRGSHGRFDVVVTSPPYLNGTNYFRNTKIELWFGRHLAHKDGLRAYRDAAITSGINDVTNGKTRSRSLPQNKLLRGVLADLEARAYDQRIPKMVASYFAEMAEVVGRLTDVARNGGVVAIDLGDSCYGDVHVPTDMILRDILTNAGCSLKKEVVLRERQSRSGRPLRQTLQIFEAR